MSLESGSHGKRREHRHARGGASHGEPGNPPKANAQAAIHEMIPYGGSKIPKREMDTRTPADFDIKYEEDVKETGRIVYMEDLSGDSGDSDPDSLFHVGAVVTTKRGSDGIVMPQTLVEYRGNLVRGGKNLEGKDLPHARPTFEGGVIARITDMTDVAKGKLNEEIADIAKKNSEIASDLESMTEGLLEAKRQERLRQLELSATPQENDGHMMPHGTDTLIMREYQDGKVQGVEVFERASDDDTLTTYVRAVAENTGPHMPISLYNKRLRYNVSLVTETIGSHVDQETGELVTYIKKDRTPLVTGSTPIDLDGALKMGREIYTAGQEARASEMADTESRFAEVQASWIAPFGKEAQKKHAKVDEAKAEEERARIEAKLKDEERQPLTDWKDGRTVYTKCIYADAFDSSDTAIARYVEAYAQRREHTLELVTVEPIEGINPKTGEVEIQFHENRQPLGTHIGATSSALDEGIKRYLAGKAQFDLPEDVSPEPGSY